MGEKSDQWLLRITAVNFVILFFGCITVFNVGIFTLLVYSVVLFFLLRRYVEKVKKDYGVLMEAASKMAKERCAGGHGSRYGACLDRFGERACHGEPGL